MEWVPILGDPVNELNVITRCGSPANSLICSLTTQVLTIHCVGNAQTVFCRLGLPVLESLYTTHFGLVLDLFVAFKGPQEGLFWPKMPLLVVFEGLGGPLGARFGPNCH